MRLFLLFLTTLFLSACDDDRIDQKETLTVSFYCENNTSLTIAFYTTLSKAVLFDGNAATELPQASSGSGFRYTDGVTTLLGKGNDITLEDANGTLLRCTASSPSH